jgi:hypothetical protein
MSAGGAPIWCLTWNVNGVAVEKGKVKAENGETSNHGRILQVFKSAFKDAIESGVNGTAFAGCIVVGLQEVISPTMFGDEALVKKRLDWWKLLLREALGMDGKGFVQGVYSGSGVALLVYGPNFSRIGDNGVVVPLTGFTVLGCKIHTKASVGIVLHTPEQREITVVNSHLPAYHYSWGIFKDRKNTEAAATDRVHAMDVTQSTMLLSNTFCDRDHCQRERTQLELLRSKPDVIWMGDFNFRSTECGDRPRDRKEGGDHMALLTQFNECEITFPRTFKLPASFGGQQPKHYTDRIVYRGALAAQGYLSLSVKIKQPSTPTMYAPRSTDVVLQRGVFEDHAPVTVAFRVAEQEQCQTTPDATCA